MKSASSNDNNLWVAAGDGQLQRVKELVEGGAQVNERDEFGYTALHAAVSYNHKDVLEYLLEHGGDINIEDFDKDTPLYVCEHADLAQFLVDHGANVHHKNSEGVSPAQTANEEGWDDVAKLLAALTGETLEKASDDDDDENDKALTYLQNDDNSDADDDMTLRPEFAQQVEQVMHKIQQDGGVQDEEELRQVVTNMVLQQVKQSIGDTPSS
ncbi:ankyrin repeat-containing domain protein [Absidia repens]|uniref:Ankyrin repeat-containing domain protein n=1 Tax=Absidia repens TaxID=90262 RepID=A0A1X2IDG6_9FUNG|nr:ankyrin repeat-containing domain protein [Absidia repens]